MKALTNYQADKGSRTGTLEHACQRYDLGKNTMRRVAEEAGAVIKIGRCYRVNFDRVDRYMEEKSQ